MLERTSTIGRYTRGFAAAVVAVAALILASNSGPAKAAEGPPLQGEQVESPVLPDGHGW
ncbi:MULTISPECIES: hypothetical protein [Streptomyces]|uniref:hypothetical protein n=1 Tax=Streptomyces TaxID=1883 RepID=UPI001784EBD4|nr:hypothetical protein [Streptomyces luteolifulvus]